MKNLSPLLLSPILLAAGCMADQGSFPSLAPRPIEQIDLSAEPSAAPAAAQAQDPAQASFVAGLLAQAEEGERGFAAAVAEAEPAIRAAAGAASGSERWIEAQIALSRIQAARAPLADALRALDERRLGSSDPALEAAFARISAMDAAQTKRLDELQAMVAPAG